MGGGVSGAACAGVLRASGVEVSVVDARGCEAGRMYSPLLHGRPVDLGAAYFTVATDEFASVVDAWTVRGLVRPWTDTFDVFAAGGRTTTTGPQRWAANDGLSALVRDLSGEPGPSTVELTDLDQLDGPVVLAMPDPQASRLAGDVAKWVDYEPVIVVAAGWERRDWDLHAAGFVNDDPTLTLIADDGSRRADAAPVLVAHTTSDRAREHLDDPGTVVGPVLEAIDRLLDVAVPPLWTHVQVWPEGKPVSTHGDAPYLLSGNVGVCGDSWCPSGSPRIESAWLSGHRLGRELARRLTGTV